MRPTSNLFWNSATPGNGNWANVPWLAFLHKAETDSTRKGTYVVYLFAENMQDLYLTLEVCVDVYYNDAVSSVAQTALTAETNKIRSFVNNIAKEHNLKILNTTEPIQLGNSAYAKKYSIGTVGFIKYRTSNLPSEQTLLNDLKAVLAIYEKYLAEKNALPETATAAQVTSGEPVSPQVTIGEDKSTEVTLDPASTTSLDVPSVITHIANFIASRGF